MNEATITQLLNNELDFAEVRNELLKLGRSRKKATFLDSHHVEPERTEIIYLAPLEHLAIHICFAKLFPSSQNRAKCGAFVLAFPGNYRRIVLLSPETKSLLLSFAQKRDASGEKLNKHPNTIAQRKIVTPAKQKAAAENGRKSAHKVSAKHKGRKILWGDKISQAAKSKPMCSCIICGKQMKALMPNIIQHQRSSKCKK